MRAVCSEPRPSRSASNVVTARPRTSPPHGSQVDAAAVYSGLGATDECPAAPAEPEWELVAVPRSRPRQSLLRGCERSRRPPACRVPEGEQLPRGLRSVDEHGLDAASR